MSKLISIVVPVYNSNHFLDKLLLAVETQKQASNWNLELILVDDGSRDNSYSKIEELSKEYPYIKGIKLARNFGHQAAVRTGLSFCKGDYVAIIDDDLQDPPNLLPGFIDYLDNGYDVAFGVRRKRKENLLKKISYRVFYRVLRQMSSVDIPLDTGDFCVMKKKVVENMLNLQEKNPYLRGMRAWVGFNQIGVEYERQSRIEGQSGYTLTKLLRIAFDGIFSFSRIPIRFITFLGFLGLGFAILYSMYLLWEYFNIGINVRGYTTIVFLLLFFGSLNLICLGVIGEYIVRIYDETLSRPHSVIDKTLNI
jgi:glycosyltransferase involved in cell wall biosynthesis